LERVAGDVGELDDLVALVVVAQHERALTERRTGRFSAFYELRVGGRGQLARAIHAALGRRVAALAQQIQRQRCRRRLGERHAVRLVGAPEVPYTSWRWLRWNSKREGPVARTSLTTSFCWEHHDEHRNPRRAHHRAGRGPGEGCGADRGGRGQGP